MHINSVDYGTTYYVYIYSGDGRYDNTVKVTNDGSQYRGGI